MPDSTPKTASKSNTAAAERRPVRPAVASAEAISALDSMRALHSQAGNRAVTRALGGGMPLAPEVRAEMESRFGTDFSEVRVHNDWRAHTSAARFDAKAYTYGSDIVFAADRFAPHASAGRRLLAHELAHVVQQRGGGAAPTLNASGSHEQDAAQAADTYAGGQSAVTVAASTGLGVAREEDDDSWSERLSRRITALKEKIPEKYREPISNVVDVVADKTVSTVLSPVAPPTLTEGLGSSLLHSGERLATGESGAAEDLKAFGRKKVQQGIGAAKAVATQVTEVVDTALWFGAEYKELRDQAAAALGGEKGSAGNTAVTRLIDTTATIIPGLAALPAAAEAGDQLKALGLVDPDTKNPETGEVQASLTAPLTAKLNAAVAWTEEQIGGTPSDPDLFTEAEKAELATSVGIQILLAFTGAEEVKIALNVAGALGGLRGIVESIRHEPDWKTSSRFWSSVIGLVLSVVGLKHTLAATKITTLLLKFGWIAAAVPPLAQMVSDYVNPDLAESADLPAEENERRRNELDRRMKQNWTQVVHVLKDAILHIAQSQGGKSAAPSEPPPSAPKNTGASHLEGGTAQPAKTPAPPVESTTANAVKTEAVNPAKPVNEGNVTPIKGGPARPQSEASKKLEAALAKQSPEDAGSVTPLRPRKGGKPPSEPQQQAVPAVEEEPLQIAVGQTHGPEGASNRPPLRAVDTNEPIVGAKKGTDASGRKSAAPQGGRTSAPTGRPGSRPSRGGPKGGRASIGKAAAGKAPGGRKSTGRPSKKAATSDKRREQPALVAVRVQGGGGKRKGTYFEEGTPQFEKVVKNKRFVVMPKEQADTLGFRPAGTAYDTSVQPLKLNGVQVESNGAGGGKANKHPITGRADTHRRRATREKAYKKTIGASIGESDGYKHLLASGELGILRAGNVSTGGVDSITARVQGTKAKIFLNDFTTPGTPKGSKATHQNWVGELRSALKDKSFGFGNKSTDRAIKNALERGEVYVRTVRVERTDEGLKVHVGQPVKVR